MRLAPQRDQWSSVTMAASTPFYEQATKVGEVISNGLTYRLYYDGDRRLTIFVLVPGQAQATGTDNAE